jgi:hypothetical protein
MPTIGIGDAMPSASPQSLSTQIAPTVSTASTLSRLPPEIIIAIFGQLCAHCQDPTCEHESDNPDEVRENLAALSAASKACKWMQTLVQPMLFHRFTALSDPVHPAQLYWFIRTLTERPDLANAVQMISLDHCRWFEPSASDQPSHRRPEVVVVREVDTKRMMAAATRLGLGAWPLEWVSLKYCDIGSVYNPREWQVGDGCIASDTMGVSFLAWLAIRLCPSLRALNVGSFMEFFPLFPFHQAVDSRIEIIRLRALDCPGWHVLGLEMQSLSVLMKLTPHLRTIQLLFARLHGPGIETGGPNDPATSPNGLDLSSLTRLDLVLCSLSRNRLRQLLRNCANLADFTCITMNHDLTLEIRETQNPPASRKGVAIQPHELTAILQHDCHHLQKTLRRLTLEHLRPFGYSYDQGYSSIDRLDGAEELYLGANGLFRERHVPYDPAIHHLSQMIPPHTRVLSIFEARTWLKEVSETLVHLLQDMATGRACLKKLKEIHVSFRPISAWLKYKYPLGDRDSLVEDGESWWLGEWPDGILDREVWKAADAAGVRLRIQRESLPPALESLAYCRAPSSEEEREMK